MSLERLQKVAMHPWEFCRCCTSHVVLSCPLYSVGVSLYLLSLAQMKQADLQLRLASSNALPLNSHAPSAQQGALKKIRLLR